MKWTWLFLLALTLTPVAGAADAGAAAATPVSPFEAEGGFVPANHVDRAVLAVLERRGIQPANRCSDAVFLRRVYLDVIGTLPEPAEVLSFLRDRREDRRARLIEALFEREEFADYWSLRWCDLLRVKAEFPINLWPNGVQAYQRWIRTSIKENRPYDEFVRALLTSSGSNFRVPPVNFYRAVQSREPLALAQAVALTFMGSRFESWPEERRAGMAAFFSRIAFKPTREWKEEIIMPDPMASGPLVATYPDGGEVTIPADGDPRAVFADWLISPRNPWFAQNVVNRLWAWLMGRGIVHEPDDLRPDNPPSNPVLLALLEKELVLSDYDLRHVLRLILNSATYQQSSIPRSEHPEAEALFARYIVRQLDAEVLIDALCQITGSSEQYMSAIPEPFTFIPEEERSIALADGSITSPFLEMFGRPARDSGLLSERNSSPTDGQRLYLLNSRDIQGRITRSLKLAKLIQGTRRNPQDLVRGIFLTILSRPPTPEELEATGKYARASRANPKQTVEDLVWALINTKEFLYRH